MISEHLDLFLIGIAVLLATAIGVWRLAKGPTLLDRMLSFDAVVITVSSLVLILSAAKGTTDFVEFVFVLSALGFLSTVAYFYYLMNLDTPDDKSEAEEGP